MLIYLAVVVLSAALANAQASFKIGGTVKTTSGDVTGQASSWRSNVSEYLGIPFAQPPVGILRWAAPVQFKGSKAISATKYGYSCSAPSARPPAANGSASNAGALMGAATDEQREDCLYLNVWAKPQTGEKKKAVMVWIYGGGFMVGSSSNKPYIGAALADEDDVVVVSMNYRLGVFGFPGMPFLEDRNVGLLDQRLAVEWVRDNIEKFGGDPERIILFGQSAGAASVDYYAYAWTEDPIVSGFIAQSGTTTTMSFAETDPVPAWYQASKKLGCGNENDGENTLVCMRSKTTLEISEAVGPVSGGKGGLNFGAFMPRPDGKIVFSDYAGRYISGTFIRRPLLIGNTENEMASFVATMGSNPRLNDPAIKSNLNGIFSCPAGTVAKARGALVPTWRYTYAGDFPNQALTKDISGAFHGSEIGLIFATNEITRKTPDSPEQLALAKKIRNAWTTFAKNPRTGLDKVWPRYDPAKETIVVLGGKNSSEITYKASTEYDRNCGMLSALQSVMSGKPASNTN